MRVMTISTNLVPSLLQALVHADGDALVLHVSDRPHVVAAGQRIDLGTRELPVDIVHQLVEQLFPAAAQTALKESGAMAYVLPEFPPFAGEHFTVVATGGDHLRVVIQRRRRETEPLVGAPTSHGRPADMSGARGVSDPAAHHPDVAEGRGTWG